MSRPGRYQFDIVRQWLPGLYESLVAEWQETRVSLRYDWRRNGSTQPFVML